MDVIFNLHLPYKSAIHVGKFYPSHGSFGNVVVLVGRGYPRYDPFSPGGIFLQFRSKHPVMLVQWWWHDIFLMERWMKCFFESMWFSLRKPKVIEGFQNEDQHICIFLWYFFVHILLSRSIDPLKITGWFHSTTCFLFPGLLGSLFFGCSKYFFARSKNPLPVTQCQALLASWWFQWSGGDNGWNSSGWNLDYLGHRHPWDCHIYLHLVGV